MMHQTSFGDLISRAKEQIQPYNSMTTEKPSESQRGLVKAKDKQIAQLREHIASQERAREEILGQVAKMEQQYHRLERGSSQQ
jgi:predicted RNase H-like nuclease (RuvC/YqgF family)